MWFRYFNAFGSPVSFAVTQVLSCIYCSTDLSCITSRGTLTLTYRLRYLYTRTDYCTYRLTVPYSMDRNGEWTVYSKSVGYSECATGT